MTLAAKPEKDSWEIAEETAELISLHFEMRDMRAYLITAGIFMKHVRLAGCRPEDFGVIEKYLVPYREHSTKQAEWWLAHGRKYHYHVHRALANEMLNVVSSFLEHAQDSGRTLTDFGTNPFELAAIKAADPELKAVLMLADGLFRFPTPLGNHAASQHGLTALIIRNGLLPDTGYQQSWKQAQDLARRAFNLVP